MTGLSVGKQGRARQWTERDDRLIRLAHQGHLTMRDLAKILRAGLPTIYARMEQLGLALRNQPRTVRDVMRIKSRPWSRATTTSQPRVSKR